jgi:hypothetical protein
VTDASVQEGDLESLLTAMFQREANAAKGVLSLVQRDGGGGTKGGVVLFDLMTCLGYSRSALLESSSGLLQSPPPPFVCLIAQPKREMKRLKRGAIGSMGSWWSSFGACRRAERSATQVFEPFSLLVILGGRWSQRTRLSSARGRSFSATGS